MLTETARVVAVDGGSVWVETVRQSVCGRCAARQGCGHSLLGRFGEGKRAHLELSSAGFPEGSFRVDDEVTVGIPERLMVGGAFVVYMLPLLAALLGAAAAPGLLSWTSDLAAVAGAAAGFLAGVALVRRHADRHRGGTALTPRLLGHARPGGHDQLAGT